MSQAVAVSSDGSVGSIMNESIEQGAVHAAIVAGTIAGRLRSGFTAVDTSGANVNLWRRFSGKPNDHAVAQRECLTFHGNTVTRDLPFARNDTTLNVAQDLLMPFSEFVTIPLRKDHLHKGLRQTKA